MRMSIDYRLLRITHRSGSAVGSWNAAAAYALLELAIGRLAWRAPRGLELNLRATAEHLLDQCPPAHLTRVRSSLEVRVHSYSTLLH